VHLHHQILVLHLVHRLPVHHLPLQVMHRVDHQVRPLVEVSIPALNLLEVHLRVHTLVPPLLLHLRTAPLRLLVDLLLRSHPLNRLRYRQPLQPGALELNQFYLILSVAHRTPRGRLPFKSHSKTLPMLASRLSTLGKLLLPMCTLSTMKVTSAKQSVWKKKTLFHSPKSMNILLHACTMFQSLS